MLGFIFLLVTMILSPFCSASNPILFFSSFLLGLMITGLSFLEEKEQRKQEVKALKHVLEEKSYFNKNLQQELHLAQHHVNAMRHDLNALRVDHYQLSIIAYMPAILPPIEPDPLYKQLRKQFEEKSTILHNTRKELFHTENTLLSLQKEDALRQLEPDTIQLELIDQLKNSYELSQKLESEINELHSLIALLAISKKPKPKKRELLQPSFI